VPLLTIVPLSAIVLVAIIALLTTYGDRMTASTQLAPVAPAVPAALVADLEVAARFAEEEKAPASRRAYRSDWKAFEGFCAARGVSSLPAAPATVAAYLGAEAEAGRRASTIARRLAAIRYAHRLQRLDSPTADEAVRAVHRGVRRVLGTAATQKAPLLASDVTRMAAGCPEDLRGLRDRAVILLGFGGAFRRSELAALDVGDVEEVPEGLRVTIRRSKTDQEGAGAVVAVARGVRACPAGAVTAWLKASGIGAGPLFRPVSKSAVVGAGRLSPFSLAKIVKRHAAAAGLDPGRVAGHSLRAGFLTSAAMRGASVLRMMDVSRHCKVDTLRGYIRRGEEFKDHAGAGLL
jgi:site-specific recombinase XerD